MLKNERVYMVIALPGNLPDAHAEVFGSEDEAQKHATESGATASVRWVNKDLAKRVMYWKRDAYVYGWLLTLLVHGNLKEPGYEGSRYGCRCNTQINRRPGYRCQKHCGSC